MDLLLDLYLKMTEYYANDPRRIQHFVKVHSFARLIGQLERLPADRLFILEAAALTHDIGIKAAETKYGRCDGKLQEKEGAPLAEKMLSQLGFSAEVISRVTFLVGHHHTYTDVDGPDYQILLEADFLVNLFEDNSSPDAVRAAYQNIFKTASGQKLGRIMFGIE